MNDCKNQAPFCTANPGAGVPSDCGFKIGATIYFVVYLLLTAYIITSLFMSSVAQFFSYNHLVSGAAAISLTNLHNFRVRSDAEDSIEHDGHRGVEIAVVMIYERNAMN